MVHLIFSYSNMAGIKKRNNTWFATFSVAGKPQVKTTGIPIVPKFIPPGKTKASMMKQNEANARTIAAELEKAAYGQQIDAAVIKSLTGPKKSMQILRGKTYMQGLKDFLHEWMKTRRETTLKNDKTAISRFLLFMGDACNMPLDMVTNQHARDFMNRELERVSSGTVGIYLANLKTAFQKAVDSRMIPHNPFSRVHPNKQSKEDKQQRRAFTMEEAKRLTEVLPGEWPDMVRVCLYTGGQRLGDIAKLKWEQIDLAGGLIAMTTQKTKRRINKPIISPLKSVFERRKASSVSEYVFPMAAMRHTQAGNTCGKLSMDLHELLKQHGFIEDIDKSSLQGNRRQQAELSFHSLRATAVTALRLAGVPSDLCRFIVGHDSEEIERVYFRPDTAAVVEAMNHLVL
ncbi:site-specific integrase [Akkermansia sp. Marseille-P9185]|uniref:tyrosine-type recombinase/integrase n=1 Tax=Akkermansia massiliensis TaxID=2927224 RepID=UPI00209BFAB5|nr:tyrosine-type recombinase/integrase [Akkermansia massiliensis]MCO8187470.1 site-specific integrase [Akkermansia massiliensis]